jgi:hypothetical protein
LARTKGEAAARLLRIERTCEWGGRTDIGAQRRSVDGEARPPTGVRAHL